MDRQELIESILDIQPQRTASLAGTGTVVKYKGIFAVGPRYSVWVGDKEEIQLNTATGVADFILDYIQEHEMNQVAGFGWKVPSEWEQVVIGEKSIMCNGTTVIPWKSIQMIILKDSKVRLHVDGFPQAYSIECGVNLEALDLFRYLFIQYNRYILPE